MPLCLRVLRARNRAQWARLFGPKRSMEIGGCFHSFPAVPKAVIAL